MNVLVVAHSSSTGGAESALVNFLDHLLALGDRATVLVPAAEGAFVEACRARRIECLLLPMHQAVPNASFTFLQLSMQGLEQVAEQLAPRGFDLVVTNTAVNLHGARLAALLKLPHVVCVHELIDDRSEMHTSGIRSDDYLRLLARGADHLLCCSEAVQQRFTDLDVSVGSSVLYPYAAGPEMSPWPAPRGTRFQLFTIGVQSLRKNPLFAVTVLQALRLRGLDAELHCIGAPGTQTPRLHAAIQRRGLGAHIALHAHAADPYALLTGPAVHLVTATSEPFGLTIPESLVRGIPVAASRSGGPEHLLAADDLFAPDDIDACVRIVERICSQHAEASERARARYKTLEPRFGAEQQRAVIAAALAAAIGQRRDKAPERFFGPALRDAVTLRRLPAERIARNIAAVARLSLEDVQARIAADKLHPGRAVMDDCRHFDVVPFTATARTDTLYREGVGFAIELAATHDDEARLGMSAFMLARLFSEAARRPLRTLALGDGIGIDTLRLIDAGLDVDYIDYDSSLTARVARQNFDSYFGSPEAGPPAHAGRVRVIADAALEAPYDAVVCLEVIEHVPDPVGFLKMLSDRLAPGGLLFISECFDGVRDHWPTHLQSNEDFAALLPLMGREFGLVLDDCSPTPFGKPYVLRKLDPAAAPGPNLARQFRDDKVLMRQTLGAVLQGGV